MTDHVLYREANAPDKPAPGAPCNGCGVCCLLEPCPLGTVLSGRRRGACAALRWDQEAALYRCGALTIWGLRRLAPRWIAAGTGCDCHVQVQGAAQSGDNSTS